MADADRKPAQQFRNRFSGELLAAAIQSERPETLAQRCDPFVEQRLRNGRCVNCDDWIADTRSGTFCRRRSTQHNSAGTAAMKVYLDNVIVSGMARGDLDPPEEMAAVRALAKANEKGQIETYTSRWSWAEQDRTRDDFIRVKLKEFRGKIEVVTDDHRVPVSNLP